MNRTPASVGWASALIAAATFGASGALIKPVLEAGWSPTAAVTVRVLVGGLALTPFAIVALRGKWATLWQSRTRVLLMALIGVAGTQVMYFAAIQRIPVGTAVLIEYISPLLLIALAWVRTRKAPRAIVIIGSLIAIGGLALVVSPGGGGGLDPLGLVFALTAMVGCAIYYLVAAQPSNGLPAVALAAAGLLLGGVVLAVIGFSGLVPFTATFVDVAMFGWSVAWWTPLLLVGILATAVAYASSIAATEILGSRLASFVGLLEVVAATLYAWILLGEQLTLSQLLGGALILAGIACVRSDKSGGADAAVATPPQVAASGDAVPAASAQPTTPQSVGSAAGS